MESSGESGFCTGSVIHRTRGSSPLAPRRTPSPTPLSNMYQQQNHHQLPPRHLSSNSSHPVAPPQNAALFSPQLPASISSDRPLNESIRAAAAFALRTAPAVAMIHSHRFSHFPATNPSNILNLDHHPHSRPTLPHHYPFHIFSSSSQAPSDIGSPSPSTDGDSVIDLQSNDDSSSLCDDRKIMRGLQSSVHPGQFHGSKDVHGFSCKEVETEMNSREGKKVRSGGKTVSHFSTPK